jgi:hypothetical protein
LRYSDFAQSRSQSKIEAFGHKVKLSRPKISQIPLYPWLLPKFKPHQSLRCRHCCDFPELCGSVAKINDEGSRSVDQKQRR